MRADRLLSLLMLLQARGRMSARRLAEELEVSERTVYRDVDALSAAGVPIYGEPGPEGGYALLDGYRTTLTGLSQGEIRALFMLSVPGPLADLGVGRELKAALLKLSAALPDTRRRDEERVRQRFHLDATWWHQEGDSAPHLHVIHQAVWEDHKLHLTYRTWTGPAIERTVDPYGLVAKAGVWYLVCARDGRVRVHRVSELLDARKSDEVFERPADFDLSVFWRNWRVEQEGNRAHYPVTVRVAPDFVSVLPRYFGDSIRSTIAAAGSPDIEDPLQRAKGWITLQLSFESLEVARDRILGFGRGVEVLEPYALRRSIQDVAEQIVALYAPSQSDV